MAAIQTPDDILSLVKRLEGKEILTLQVLGINSLKSISPMPDELCGDVIETTSVDDRAISVTTATHQLIFDLQRTGRLAWLSNAAPFVMALGSPRPTVRLILADGEGLDMSEPAKTKRITVTISKRT